MGDLSSLPAAILMLLTALSLGYYMAMITARKADDGTKNARVLGCELSFPSETSVRATVIKVITLVLEENLAFTATVTPKVVVALSSRGIHSVQLASATLVRQLRFIAAILAGSSALTFALGAVFFPRIGIASLLGVIAFILLVFVDLLLSLRLDAYVKEYEDL